MDRSRDVPPVAFTFQVTWPGGQGAFSEVSGLSSEVAMEEVREGGSNMRGLQMFKKPPTLICKRGLGQPGDWLLAILEVDFSKAIHPGYVKIELHNELGALVSAWTLDRAWPVKHQIGRTTSATTGEVAFEELEFVGDRLRRDDVSPLGG